MVMSKIEEVLYEELSKKEYWDLTYDRMMGKPFSDSFFDNLFIIKETDERLHIAKQLIEGTYVWSIPEKLELAKSGTSKKRIVYMYSEFDRYIIGVLYRVLSQVFYNYIAPNCYSYKTKTNTSDAIKDISKTDFLFSYGLKLDIQAYFNSVNRDHLNKCLTELFGEDTGIRKTLDGLYNNDRVLYRGKEIEEYKGLIPGCALGSFFANYCLREIDYYFLEKGITYARYSDDIIFFANSKEELDITLEYLKAMLAKYKLEINENKYVYFEPGEMIEYLGLKLDEKGIDVSTHAKKKMKRLIKRWVRKARMEIEIDGRDFEKVAKRLISRFNYRIYKCFIEDARKFGWAFYAFRYITVTDSLIEIDYYFKDRLRYLKTGKNNKANIKALSNEEIDELGWVSMYEMYRLFKEDFDYYCEVVSLLK